MLPKLTMTETVEIKIIRRRCLKELVCNDTSEKSLAYRKGDVQNCFQIKLKETSRLGPNISQQLQNSAFKTK